MPLNGLAFSDAIGAGVLSGASEGMSARIATLPNRGLRCHSRSPLVTLITVEDVEYWEFLEPKTLNCDKFRDVI